MTLNRENHGFYFMLEEMGFKTLEKRVSVMEELEEDKSTPIGWRAGYFINPATKNIPERRLTVYKNTSGEVHLGINSMPFNELYNFGTLTPAKDEGEALSMIEGYLLSTSKGIKYTGK